MRSAARGSSESYGAASHNAAGDKPADRLARSDAWPSFALYVS